MALLKTKVISYDLKAEYDPYGTGACRYHIIATIERRFLGIKLGTTEEVVGNPIRERFIARKKLKELRHKIEKQYGF